LDCLDTALRNWMPRSISSTLAKHPKGLLVGYPKEAS
jgi:hypothetical protein